MPEIESPGVAGFEIAHHTPKEIPGTSGFKMKMVGHKCPRVMNNPISRAEPAKEVDEVLPVRVVKANGDTPRSAIHGMKIGYGQSDAGVHPA